MTQWGGLLWVRVVNLLLNPHWLRHLRHYEEQWWYARIVLLSVYIHMTCVNYVGSKCRLGDIVIWLTDYWWDETNRYLHERYMKIMWWHYSALRIVTLISIVLMFYRNASLDVTSIRCLLRRLYSLEGVICALRILHIPPMSYVLSWNSVTSF